MKLKGKVALITRAGQNIRRAIALAIAQEGGGVILVTRKNWDSIIQVAQGVSALDTRALPLLAICCRCRGRQADSPGS